MAAPTFVQFVEPASNWGSTADGATRTTGSFSTTASSVLVIFGGAEDETFTIDTPPVGGSLTYTLQQDPAGTGGASDDAEAKGWTAIATGGSMTVAVTCSGSTGNRAWGDCVYNFSGSDGVGASNSSNGTTSSGPPSINLTTTQANSAVVVFVVDFNAVNGNTRTWAAVNAIVPTIGNGLEKVYNRNASTMGVYSAYYSDVGAVGSKAFGLTVPATMDFAIIAIEVKGTVTAPPAAKARPPFHRPVRFRR